MSGSPVGGGYLLSHFRSTIGVVRLNFSVRNGKRWDPHAMAALVRFCSPDGLEARGCGGKRNHRGERSRGKTRGLRRDDLLRKSAPHACSLVARNSRAESFRVISTARLRTLPPVHLQPIDVVVFNDPKGDLILRLASCLDAFSTYPYLTRLPGRAPGGTTGWPEVSPTRSSRTSVRSPQISSAHNR